MPNAGPVYQPTTVSYEQQGEWTSPTGLLSHTNGIGRARCLQWIALAFGLLAVSAGLIMIIEGSLDLADTRQNDDALHQPREYETDIVVIVIGCFILLVGMVLIGLYIKYSTQRKGCPCFLTKEQRMVHQLRDTQSINGQTMNPSTDLLVSAQYAPVSEIAYQPPAISEEEETRKLMGSDNKDCLLKESNSVITLNPLRFEPEDSPELRRFRYPFTSSVQDIPMSDQSNTSVNERPSKSSQHWKNTIMRKASVRSKKAPLAGVEEITPSLRSSWSSIYFNNNTPTDSSSDGLSFISDAL